MGGGDVADTAAVADATGDGGDSDDEASVCVCERDGAPRNAESVKGGKGTSLASVVVCGPKTGK